jgi:hypothetical protein
VDISYPEDSWGMKLGWKVNNFRYRGDYADFRVNFENLGVLGEKAGVDRRSFEYIYEAFVAYKGAFGDLNVPRDWSVPSSAIPHIWGDHLWGLKLGYRAHNIRYRGDFLANDTCRGMLADLGFRFSGKGSGRNGSSGDSGDRGDSGYSGSSGKGTYIDVDDTDDDTNDMGMGMGTGTDEFVRYA